MFHPSTAFQCRHFENSRDGLHRSKQHLLEDAAGEEICSSISSDWCANLSFLTVRILGVSLFLVLLNAVICNLPKVIEWQVVNPVVQDLWTGKNNHLRIIIAICTDFPVECAFWSVRFQFVDRTIFQIVEDLTG